MTQNDCVFCDKSKFEERLVGETKDSWIIATLGQITPGYVLLVPKRHVKCVGAMNKKEVKLLEKLTIKTSEALFSEYYACGISFEHGVVGQTINHAHIHIIPGNYIITQKILNDFPNSKFDCIVSLSDFRNNLYASRKEPYLLWNDPFGMRVCWNPPAPPQYLRIVVAEALGRPERANWKNMDPELDQKLWSETVRRLKPYFTK